MVKGKGSMNERLSEFDKDWIKLISEAKRSGFGKKEVRNFLKRNGQKEKVTYHRSY